jgi:hypothetical protein
LDAKDAKQLDEDVIRPNLNILNLKVKTIKEKAQRNLKTDIVLLATLGVFGFLSNMTAFQMMLLTASGLTLADFAQNLRNGLMTPSKIRDNDMYFLWKATKKRGKKRPKA